MKNYLPVLRTSDAELRALKFLSDEVKSKIIPVFELTRSRKTKTSPDGSVSLRIKQVVEIYGRNRFILDVSTESDLINNEIISFFDQTNGYQNWVSFLSSILEVPIIPCALYEEDGSKANFCDQVRSLVSRFGYICIRGSATESDLLRQLIIWAREVASDEQIIVGGSLYFIPQGMLPNYELLAQRFVEDVVANNRPLMVFVSSSAYPKYVVESPYGNDVEGSFDALEIDLTEFLQSSFPNINMVHSDYASVHPIRYNTIARGWVPRVDAVTERKYQFKRYRDSDGGYLRAAREIYNRTRNSLVDCWGTSQIVDAAVNNRLAGRSPSFWISVRINQWISRTAR